MRHRKKGKTLGREKDPRRALMRSLATSLVLREKITTTEAKAKALRPVIEKYITAAKTGDLATRRRLLTFFYDERAVKKMIEKIGPFYKTRKGGYTRIIKAGTRQGDGAKMAMIEFVDFKKKTDDAKKPAAKPAKKIESKKESTSAKASEDRKKKK